MSKWAAKRPTPKLVSAGAASTARTMYEAVTGKPMPNTKDARAMSMMASNTLLPATADMSNENLMPTPTINTTPTTMPEQSRMMPVLTRLCAPKASASKISRKFMRVLGLSQLATTMLKVPKDAA